MKMISKVATTVLGLAFIGSSVFAQSIADAKKAIDAEQFQKAKSILKNLTSTQPTKGENFFYLGLAYIKTDYPDSAKTAFNQGIAAEDKYSLNYVGLGWLDRLDKNSSAAKANFDKALTFVKKKDTEPYPFIGRGYLLEPDADPNTAIEILKKGIALNPKDAELYSALGDAYRSQLKNSEAYQAYAEALAINPKLISAVVATGVIWKYANNFEDSEKEFQKAIAMDPNYGPAYRELAETSLRWASTMTTSQKDLYDVKLKQAADYYKKYLDLTDLSVDSRMRYADFLITAKDYKQLETEANAIAQMDKSNLRVYRYLGYSGFENGHFEEGLTALSKFFKEADPKRVIPRDYLYLGRLELATGQDAEAIKNLNKAYELDTTQVDVFSDLAKYFYKNQKYAEAADSYAKYIEKSPKRLLNDYLNLGISYYFAYNQQYSASLDDTSKTPDAGLLVKADSAFTYILKTTQVPAVILYLARTKDLQETDRNAIAGLAKPVYEQYISVVGAKSTQSDAEKKGLGESYAYLGSFYAFSEKDDAKADENFVKAREFDPENKQVAAYFDRKKAAPTAKTK